MTIIQFVSGKFRQKKINVILGSHVKLFRAVVRGFGALHITVDSIYDSRPVAWVQFSAFPRFV